MNDNPSVIKNPLIPSCNTITKCFMCEKPIKNTIKPYLQTKTSIWRTPPCSICGQGGGQYRNPLCEGCIIM